MAKIDDILRLAVSRKASDIHFSAESRVMFRQHGDLVALDEKVYSNVELQEILMEIIDEKDKKRFTENKNLDKSYSVPNCGNFRLNFFWTRRGVGAVIRWLPTRMPEIDDLGLPPIIKKLADLPKGLLLVTGPTGSGKSTTLAAIINYMNTNFAYHILTVEDPVEFVHPCKKSLINQREIGQSCLTFSDALKYALREDPDVILVGEMRDQETIGLALTAAETGHLVLGTLHTRGAASSVDRIIESFPATERPLIRVMLSESLRAVISQILLKSKEGNSRVACYEIMVANYAISNLIREGKTFQIQSILQTAKGEGMMQMEAHIRQLMAEGKVDPVDADAALSSMMRANQNSGPASSAPGAGQQKTILPLNDVPLNQGGAAGQRPEKGAARPGGKPNVANKAPLAGAAKLGGAEAPALKAQAPAMKVETPAAKPQAPAIKLEAPAMKPQAPAAPTLPESAVVSPEPEKAQTSSIKIDAPPKMEVSAKPVVRVEAKTETKVQVSEGSLKPLTEVTSGGDKTVAGITVRAPKSTATEATSPSTSMKSLAEGTKTAPTAPRPPLVTVKSAAPPSVPAAAKPVVPTIPKAPVAPAAPAKPPVAPKAPIPVAPVAPVAPAAAAEPSDRTKKQTVTLNRPLPNKKVG